MLRDNLVGLIEPMRNGAGADPLALSIQQQASDDRSICLENPRPEGAESSLTENVTSPFQAEPAHLYGLAADQKGNLWAAGWQKGTINKWDVDTEAVKEYKVPNSWGQVRRIGVDSKGIVWASEYITGILARLDPATGNLTEYKIPLSGAKPYDCWPDKSDNIWMPDRAHSALIKFDQKTSKFTFYPMPQPHQDVNKLQVANDNTMWLPTRFQPITAGVHFYPDGYTSDALPIP